MGKKKDKKGKKGKDKGKAKAAASAATAKKTAASSGMSTKEQQILPAKFAKMFDGLTYAHQRKQYKRALKSADAILEKYPENGETLAIKGLILMDMSKSRSFAAKGKKAVSSEDPEALVKKGLSKNFKSSVCWHVCGLMNRANNKYDDAIKCFQRSLMFRKGDLQVLKDLGTLQVQRRMYEGFEETRRQILVKKSNSKGNWISYVVGCHLSKHYKKALYILGQYLDTLDLGRSEFEYEDSEVQLYKAQVLEESGDLEGALAHLSNADVVKQLCDPMYVLEKKAELLIKLGRGKEAVNLYDELITCNQENYSYYHGLACALELTTSPTSFTFVADLSPEALTEKVDRLLTLLDKLSATYPKCLATKRLALDVPVPADACSPSHLLYKQRLHAFVVASVKRGVPALFRDLQPLYADSVKRTLLQELVGSFTSSLAEHQVFPPSPSANNVEEKEQEEEDPSCLMWMLFYAAQHFDHLQAPRQALEAIDQAIGHTCTNLDLYVVKARILKHAGNLVEAYANMEKARKLDTADRYINTKCVRYAFRAGEFEEGDETVKLFLREGDGLESSMDTLQVLWYETCKGEEYMKRKDFHRALLSLHHVKKHFFQFNEDQFDYHGYCLLRKFTLRSYIDMLRTQDSLKAHRYFARSAKNAVRVYMELFDMNLRKEEAAKLLPELTEEEKKRAAKKAKREENKRKRLADAKALESKDGKKEEKKEEVKHAETKDPLAEATLFYSDLSLHRGEDLEVQLLGIELYTRKNKLLLAAKCIRSAFRILSSVSTPTSIPPHFHIAIIRFLAAAQAASFSSSDAGAEKGDVRENTIKLILGEEVNFIYSTLASYYASSSSPASAEEYNQLYLSQHSTSFPHRLAFAQSLVLTKAGTDEVKEEAIQLCAQVGVGCDVEVSRSSITRAAANEALAFISSLSSPSVSADTAEESAAVAAFKQSVSSLFPLDNQLMDSFSMERCKERAEALTAVY